MIHHCPMCGEQWDEDRCRVCGWCEERARPTRLVPSRSLAKRLSAQGVPDVAAQDAPRRRQPARLERHEQADGVKLLRSLGAAVYVLGTVRRKGDYQGTMQTPGIADVEAWLPRRVGPDFDARDLSTKVLLKWEVKRSLGGRISPEQAAYRQHCEDAGVAYVCGDLTALMQWLVREGYLRADQLASRQP